MDWYHRLIITSDKDYTKKKTPKCLAFFRKVFLKYKVKTILDCACGSGMHVYYLSRFNYDVKGSDCSKAIIAFAKKKYPKLKLKFQVADFRKLEQKFKDKFDCILCWGTALPHLRTDKDVIKALKSMYNQINNKGILVIQQVITDNNKNKFGLLYNAPKESILFIFDYFQKRIEANLIYLLHTKKQHEFKTTKVIFNRTLTGFKLKKFLKKVGFKKISFYENYNFKKYNTKKSNNLILIAEKF